MVGVGERSTGKPHDLVIGGERTDGIPEVGLIVSSAVLLVDAGEVDMPGADEAARSLVLGAPRSRCFAFSGEP